MSQARAAINTLLKVGGGGSPESFTTIGNVSSIDGPGITVDVVDVTTHSNANAWRKKLATLIDAGQLSFDLFWDPDDVTHNASVGTLGDIVNRIRQTFRVEFPVGPTNRPYFEFSGYYTSHSFSFPVDGVITAKVTVTIDGPILFGLL